MAELKGKRIGVTGVMAGAAYYRLAVPTTAATLRFAPTASTGSTFAANQEAQLGVFRLQ